MATIYTCDICKQKAKEFIRVDWRQMYCKKCWKDTKNWPSIHKKGLLTLR